jgi:hypothetical protein
VDPSGRKLVDEFLSLWQQRTRLDERMNALRVSMDVLGIRVPNDYGYMGTVESRYAERKPFRDCSLGASCLTVLTDHHEISLDKNQMEFFLILGGYPFEAKDPTNSVEITLRKLAVAGKCKVTKGAGPSGSRYRLGPIQSEGLNENAPRKSV